MVSYGHSTPAYGSNWQVMGYSNDNSSYSVTTSSWKKSHCCQSFKFGQRCSDCPGN
ncbi:MAG: hypothetical protein WCV90_08605 [Candidatus Woesearchaeota archaeon]